MAKKVVEIDPNLTLDEAIRDYLASNAEIEKLEQRKAVCKATIDKAITKNGGEKVVGKYGYALRSLCTRSSLDAKLVEKVLNVKVTDECYKVTEYTQTKVYENETDE
jgi:hypothetical protein